MLFVYKSVVTNIKLDIRFMRYSCRWYMTRRNVRQQSIQRLKTLYLPIPCNIMTYIYVIDQRKKNLEPSLTHILWVRIYWCMVYWFVNIVFFFIFFFRSSRYNVLDRYRTEPLLVHTHRKSFLRITFTLLILIRSDAPSCYEQYFIVIQYKNDGIALEISIFVLIDCLTRLPLSPPH